MAIKGTVEEETWRHEEGWYPARLESIVEEKVKFVYKAHHAAVTRGEAKAGEEGGFTKWRWTVTLLGGDYDGDKVRVDTNPNIPASEGDLRWIMYSAFLGRPLEVGEGFDTSDVEGRTAEVLVANDVDGYARSGKKYSTIASARPGGQGVVVKAQSEEPPF